MGAGVTGEAREQVGSLLLPVGRTHVIRLGPKHLCHGDIRLARFRIFSIVNANCFSNKN